MRVSTSWMQQQSVGSMMDRQGDLSDLNIQLSTGKRINQPSDDPVGAARALDLTHLTADAAQYQRNITSANARLGLEDQTLSNTSNVLGRVRTLLLQAANGSQTDETRGDNDDRHENQRAAHRRRSRLREMGLRAVVAHRLANLHPREPADHPRADHERDHQRRHRRQHGAQRDVREHIELADLAREHFGEPQQHQCTLPTSCSHSAATTASIRMKREPLTSTVTGCEAPTPASAVRSESASART